MTTCAASGDSPWLVVKQWIAPTRMSLQPIGLSPAPVAPAIPTTPSSNPATPDVVATDRTMAAVAARMWEADRRVRNECQQVPRSEQIGDKHVYNWFTDAANHYALRHFPELQRLKSGAATRVEHTHSIGEGLSIRLDTQDTSKEPPLAGGNLPLQGCTLAGWSDGCLFFHHRRCKRAWCHSRRRRVALRPPA